MSSQYTYGEWQYISSHEFRGYVRDVYDQNEASRDPSFNNPRTQQPVDEVAQQLQQTSLDPSYGSSPPGGGSYTTNVYSSSPPVSKGKGKAKEEPKSSSHKHHSSSKDSSSKGKQAPVPSSSKSKHSESRDSGKSRKHKDDKYDAAPEDPFYATSSAQSVAYSYRAQASVGNTRADVSAMNPTQGYSTSDAGYATSPVDYSAVAQPSYTYATPSGLAPISEGDPYLGNAPYPGSSYGGYAPPVSRGSDQKQALASSSKKGKKDWSSGLPETIDPRYVVEPSKKFAIGQVFKILWSEPRGQTTREDIDKMTEKAKVRTEFGDVFYISFRRYIVAREDQGHSICVPILTYEGKACSKRGVKPEKHGIIYDAYSRERDPTKPLRSEPSLGFKAIKMISTVRDEKLAKESRINYSKPMTIEHNVRVFFIGYIPDEDLETFLAAVDKSWAPKKKR
ncbi:uncharacterized protein E0L32_012344 [Thyridium curvatum]|uniref:DUF6590 domain-containing protein n=1 Tax=Thyridium curvatum TaxID=1093900 RepID=A0A507BJX3_9PEZI|nr:uncharacterized protein E0L32_012344 [Thyridium curvatum]TPX16998.1 hypothetical protein E0L32_012344 [Thyridium curvatum]